MHTEPNLSFDTDKENALIRAAADGDNTAFDDLVLMHKDRVYNLCCWFLAGPDEADDMAQEVFIKAFRSLKSFRFESKFSTWLYRIAVNTCKNRVNSLQYRLKKWTAGLDAADGPGNDGADDMVMVRSESPADLLEQKERSRRIRRAVNQLPRDKKALVVLRDMEGLAYEEIARITGLAMGTVKSKLARARADLQEKLKDV
jgi:RNA polymerase sigma-70 factor, ECF subfamily